MNYCSVAEHLSYIGEVLGWNLQHYKYKYKHTQSIHTNAVKVKVEGISFELEHYISSAVYSFNKVNLLNTD